MALLIGANYCRISGMVGGNKDALYPAYVGAYLGIDAANKVFGNVIDLTDSGCVNGSVDFTNSGGGNVVRVRGWKQAGETTVANTPHDTDDVDIHTNGPNGVTLVKPANVDWLTDFVPVVSSSGGAITTKSATCRHRKVGRTVHVHIVVTITTNGTGAGVVRATLPFTPASTSALLGIDGNTLAALVGATNTAGSLVSIATAAGAYPGADGKTLIVSGSYEANQ